MTLDFHITTYGDLIASRPTHAMRALQDALDEIFFSSSNTQSFVSDIERAQFRERWLGRYLTHDPQWCYLALTPNATVAGYLAGCLDDPARTARFADIRYFAEFAALTARYPAHLHINLQERFRNGGIGSALIARFCADAGKAGAIGVHVVTSRGARNMQFYARNGFREAGAQGMGGKEVVFLARALDTHANVT